MDLQYQLKAGNYYLYDMRDAPSAVTGERRFKLKTDTVAIAFDMQTGEVHRHGNPVRIQSWAQHQRRRVAQRHHQQQDRGQYLQRQREEEHVGLWHEARREREAAIERWHAWWRVTGQRRFG